MTTEAQSTIRDAVRSAYGGRAREVLAGSASGAASGVAAALYAGEAADLPEGVVSYGCGNPVAIAGLQPVRSCSTLVPAPASTASYRGSRWAPRAGSSGST